MSKRIFIDGNINSELCIIATDGQNINYFDYSDELISSKKNNIYLGKVSRIEPSLQAAFVDFGRERHGFLSFNDIQSDYYQIPKSDLEIIKQEEEKVREELSKEDEAKENKNLEEGKLEIDDPIEKKEDAIEKDSTDHENKENKFRFKKYKIQEVIKPNQVILVQVLKDERGLKGAALTTFISIAGK